MIRDFKVNLQKYPGLFSMSKHHYHDYYEIYYLLSGERCIYIENRVYDVKKGSILFINKNDIHRTVDTGIPNHERMVVYFTDPFLDQFHGRYRDLLLSPFTGDQKMLQLNIQEQNSVERLLFQMYGEYSRGESGRDVLFEALLVQLLLFAVRKMEQKRECPAHPMHAKMAQIIAFCNENFMTELNLETISRRFFISPYHFCRLFKQITGFTFSEYIATLRIREAQRLLRETNEKIITISEQVGFANVTHFNRKFKQVTRMTPREYKKMAAPTS
jgi:AraC-like DNA-binding protein